MAGRSYKNIVEYFSHDCNHGKTLPILEHHFQNDGYAAWFKTLETLGNSENHYIDCRIIDNWEFLQAKININSEKLQAFYDKCAELSAIHPELWSNKIIWSANFIKNLADLYNRRKQNCLNFNQLCEKLSLKMNFEYDSNGDLINGSIEEKKQKQKKIPKKKESDNKKFIPPSLDEVKKYFDENGYTEEAAIKAYEHYNLADWHDTEGKSVRNWKQKMHTVWFKEENKKGYKKQGKLPLGAYNPEEDPAAPGSKVKFETKF